MTLVDTPPETFVETPTPPPAAIGRPGRADGHRLRLCLDLVLDAAVLTLRAAARETLVRDARRDGGSVIPRPAAPGPAPGPPVPWRRWLNEDVELIWSLAAALPEGPPVLPAGGDAGPDLDARVLRDLRERYEAIRDGLADVLAQAGAGDGSWQPRIRTALTHCRGRLGELAALSDPGR